MVFYTPTGSVETFVEPNVTLGDILDKCIWKGTRHKFYHADAALVSECRQRCRSVILRPLDRAASETVEPREAYVGGRGTCSGMRCYCDVAVTAARSGMLKAKPQCTLAALLEMEPRSFNLNLRGWRR
jgi:hypothetical protein